MLKEIFQAAGISEKEGEIYQILLENGKLSAGKIAKLTPYKRSLVYKTLESLSEKGLVLKLEPPGKVATFESQHPAKIKEILEKKAENLSYYQKNIDSVLPQLVSSYNLSAQKPGVSFFEGEEGLRKTLEDTLTSQTEIYLFINNDGLSQENLFSKINAEYVKKRQHAKIKKKIIEAGKEPELTFGTTDNAYDAVTEIRYLKKLLPSFKSSLQIYDGKISYQIVKGEKMISVLVTDPEIFAMHKAWFEAMWESLG